MPREIIGDRRSGHSWSPEWAGGTLADAGIAVNPAGAPPVDPSCALPAASLLGVRRKRAGRLVRELLRERVVTGLFVGSIMFVIVRTALLYVRELFPGGARDRRCLVRAGSRLHWRLDVQPAGSCSATTPQPRSGAGCRRRADQKAQRRWPGDAGHSGGGGPDQGAAAGTSP